MAGRKAGGAAAWLADHQLWIELFALFNFAGLIGDIFLAHSSNHFRRSSEYLPLYFSVASAAALAAVLPLRRKWPAAWRDVGHLVGWLAIALGLAGVVLHLDSRFFDERTIRSLTYAAPFAAPQLALVLICGAGALGPRIESPGFPIILPGPNTPVTPAA